MARRHVLAAAAATIIATTTVVQAQQTCLTREVIVQKLGEGYSERLVGRGLQGEARLFEVFMSRDGSSWTIIQSFPTGLSCIMAAGTHWQQDDISQVFSADG
ncbi:hypothetical protein AB3Y40_15715 [Yoonia sp. R2331]|uniref:hypothetical protein n=1 Tax=Yoonia sp. R2331 TaxID=3237238 RepID=UPI0034E49E91